MELAIGKLKVAQWLVIHPPQPLSSTPALVAQRSELASLRSGGSRVFTQDISTSGHLRLKELFRHSLYIHSVRSRGHPRVIAKTTTTGPSEDPADVAKALFLTVLITSGIKEPLAATCRVLFSLVPEENRIMQHSHR